MTRPLSADSELVNQRTTARMLASNAASLARPFLALFVVVLVFWVADFFKNGEHAHFASTDNLTTVTANTAIVAVAALGMTVVIIAGGIDLSVGTAIALSATMLAWTLKEDVVLRIAEGDSVAGISQKIKQVENEIQLAQDESTKSVANSRLAALTSRQEAIKTAASRWAPWTLALAILVGIGTGCICGLINGVLISYLRIVPFIVTLGTMQLFLGWAKWVAAETTVRPDRATQIPVWLSDLLSIKRTALIVGLPAGVWVALGLAAILAAVLHFTVFGRYVFAIGSNESTARLCGIHVRWNKIAIYTLGGLFVGIAGVWQFSRLCVGNPSSGLGLELKVIASVIIGGGSLNGGRASVLGTLTGALIMSVITSGCTALGVTNPIQDMLLGIIIIVAVAVDQLRQGRQTN